MLNDFPPATALLHPCGVVASASLNLDWLKQSLFGGKYGADEKMLRQRDVRWRADGISLLLTAGEKYISSLCL